MKKKVLKWSVIALSLIILALGGMIIYAYTHPVTDCDCCINGKTP